MYSSVVTLANSIIGVSILAMPYCFKQCGIVLATLMVILSGIIVKLSSHLLLKSAIMARRRNIEYLAFHTYGQTGKLLVELGIIGFLMGTAIAFFVVMGDLGPPLISNLAGIEPTANLRLVILTGLGLFVALPLSLLRNIESLQIICATSLLFYLLVVFRVVLEASPHLTSTHWFEMVNLWRPAGMLQCFPIFSMALSCQTNIFEVYASLHDATPQKMNQVVKGAVNLCSAIYITIGFFGYIAFCTLDFGGNILTSFSNDSRFIDFLKLGFVISVAVSFPLVVFPCRTSLHSLLFRKTYQGIGSTELVTDYIPPARFNIITFCLICVTLVIGIMVPDIELVLGMVGSTMGASICVIFPAVAFLKLTTKNTTERLAAQTMLVIGIITLILGTYVNLVEHTSSPGPVGQPGPAFVKPMMEARPPPDVGGNIEKTGDEVIQNISSMKTPKAPEESPVKAEDVIKEEEKKVDPVKNPVEPDSPEDEKVRQEPAIPEAPDETKQIESKEADQVKEVVKSDVKEEETVEKKAILSEERKEDVDKENETKEKEEPEKIEKSEEGAKAEEPAAAEQKNKTSKEIDPSVLLEELVKQKKEQEEILKEQKQILIQLKEHQLRDAEDLHAVHQKFQEAAADQGQDLVAQAVPEQADGQQQQAVQPDPGLSRQLRLEPQEQQQMQQQNLQQNQQQVPQQNQQQVPQQNQQQIPQLNQQQMPQQNVQQMPQQNQQHMPQQNQQQMLQQNQQQMPQQNQQLKPQLNQQQMSQQNQQQMPQQNQQQMSQQMPQQNQQQIPQQNQQQISQQNQQQIPQQNQQQIPQQNQQQISQQNQQQIPQQNQQQIPQQNQQQMLQQHLPQQNIAQQPSQTNNNQQAFIYSQDNNIAVPGNQQVNQVSSGNVQAVGNVNAGYQPAAQVNSANQQPSNNPGNFNANYQQPIALQNSAIQQSAVAANAGVQPSAGANQPGNHQPSVNLNAAYQQPAARADSGNQQTGNLNAAYQAQPVVPLANNIPSGNVNAGYQQQAGIVNPGNQQQAGIVNPGNQQQAGIVNTGNLQQAGIVNPGNQQQAGIVNPGNQQQAGIVNTGNQQQAGIVNPGNQQPMGSVNQQQRASVNSGVQQSAGNLNSGVQQLRIGEAVNVNQAAKAAIPNRPAPAVDANQAAPVKQLNNHKIDTKAKVGRDLKADRRTRREICENDPSCDEKFDRNPLKDSYLDDDYSRLLNIGKRSLLADNSDNAGGNYSKASEYGG